MTPYLGYAPARTEFAARDVLEALDITCIVPRKVEMVRLPKRRRPEPVESPSLQSYIFAAMTAEQWHLARAEGVMRTVRMIGPKEWARVLKYAARVEADYQCRMEQIERGERIMEYQPGQALEILGDDLLRSMARFKRIIEGAVPMLEVEMDCAMGRFTATVDPIYAKPLQISAA